jgi:hypothetical protein
MFSQISRLSIMPEEVDFGGNVEKYTDRKQHP